MSVEVGEVGADAPWLSIGTPVPNGDAEAAMGQVYRWSLTSCPTQRVEHNKIFTPSPPTQADTSNLEPDQHLRLSGRQISSRLGRGTRVLDNIEDFGVTLKTPLFPTYATSITDLRSRRTLKAARPAARCKPTMAGAYDYRWRPTTARLRSATRARL